MKNLVLFGLMGAKVRKGAESAPPPQAENVSNSPG